ncbi:MAG: UDP-N-acetylmuramate--L-alanine ligase [Actinomycetota bacterium]|nr:UDP-N-acetylmuramate--L-alanine ligase [Actinomycetota bacterium]
MTAGRLDLSRPRRIHLVGVGGAGMSAIAVVLAEMGHEVSGSDLRAGPVLERLRASGVRALVGHDARHVDGAEVLAISTAVGEHNPEVRAARQLGVPVHSRAEALAALSTERRCVAVAGTHGKTTTSSMLALCLVDAGRSPSFLIGGDLPQIGTNAAWGSGEWLVVEADESDGTFLELAVETAVVTNVEPDHLDHFGSVAALEEAFGAFLATARHQVVCSDDPVLRRIAPPGAHSYGFLPGAEFQLSGLRGGRSEIAFSCSRDGELLGEVELPVPGRHNALNAAAALVAAELVGVDFEESSRALARFGGVARRFEFRGERNGVVFVDDYAHLPGEVVATLAAARRGGFGRVVCVFQPHRYSRTAALATSFADAFVDADVLVVTGVYAAGEQPLPGVSGALVADAIGRAHPDAAIEYVPARGDVAARLRGLLRPGDCCLSLSAGDLTSLPDELLSGPAW